MCHYLTVRHKLSYHRICDISFIIVMMFLIFVVRAIFSMRQHCSRPRNKVIPNQCCQIEEQGIWTYIEYLSSLTCYVLNIWNNLLCQHKFNTIVYNVIPYRILLNGSVIIVFMLQFFFLRAWPNFCYATSYLCHN